MDDETQENLHTFHAEIEVRAEDEDEARSVLSNILRADFVDPPYIAGFTVRNEQEEKCDRHARKIAAQIERVRSEYIELWDLVNEAEDDIGDAVYPLYDSMPTDVKRAILSQQDDQFLKWLEQAHEYLDE